jgi:2-iminoacetate synthase
VLHCIEDQFYRSLFATSLEQYRGLTVTARHIEGALVNDVIGRRTENGLDVADAALLLHLLRDQPNEEARQRVLDHARLLRSRSFGNAVATMVPIEVTSYCASTCRFCGWRADNKEMVRLAITEDAIREQARILAAMGFSHFEIAGGDHLPFLKSGLHQLVAALKEETIAVNPAARVSLCLVPMHESQYSDLKGKGLDCVLTWQETYDESLFRFHVPSGPKAWGIDLQFNMTKGGDGFLQRLKSQEMAIRAGLQAGLGAMIGLSANTEADILSVIAHGRRLIDHYGEAVQPLIIGMPAWNPITTAGSDNRQQLAAAFDVVGNIELIAAIYLLAFPDRRAWVFANGRVPPQTQADCVSTASCFTSTLVQIAPGAYLGLAPVGTVHFDRKKMFAKSSVAFDKLTQETIMSGEQFMHYLMSHDEFVRLFMDRGLRVVPDSSLIH